MSVQLEKKDNSMALLTIEVGADVLDAAIERAYHKNKGRINVPGFRRGKAPRKVIERIYGPEIFYQDAADDVVDKEYPKAAEECGEKIVSSPRIDVTQIEAGKPMIFTAEVALRPPVGLGKYKGIEIEKQDVDVTGEDIDDALESERKRQARWVEVTDRAVQADDEIVLDFEGFVDGAPFDGGKDEDYKLVIGSGSFIPGFEDQLIGKEAGKECEVNVTFPEDYHAKELAGKPAVFKCTVKTIREQQMPELNDEFASDVSEFDTLAEYREDLEKKLRERKEREAKALGEDACVRALVEDSEIELPEPMVETQQRQMVNDFARQIMMQGMDFGQYMQMTNSSPERMMDQVRPQAIERIKSRLVLEEVAEKEGLAVTDDELRERIEEMAKQYRTEASVLRENMGEREEQQLREDMAVEKAAAFLLEHAKTAKKAKKRTEDAEDGGTEKKTAHRTASRKKKETTEE